jgi:antitoxin (DNA-binding transcriptional repressor) of toxin-antitoxin stability system
MTMQQIDLDDLPPRTARALAGLRDGEEITLVQAGIVVGVLRASTAAPPPTAPAETDMAEVMEQFGAIIEDEF